MLAIYPQPLPGFLLPLLWDLLRNFSSFFTVAVHAHQHGFILCFLCLITAASFSGCPPTRRSPLPVSLSSSIVYAGLWLPIRTSFRIPMSRSHCVCTLTLYAVGCRETYAYRAHWSSYCYISFSYSWEIPMESHGNRRISLFAEPAPWTVVTGVRKPK